MKLRILALAAVAAFACSSGEDAPKPAPSEEPAPPAEKPAPPTPPRAADAAAGGKLYATFCATCHGARGAADGPASNMDPKPAHHDDGTYMNGLSNEHLMAVIKLGGPAVGKSPLMAPWGGTLDDQQIRDVIAFVRTLADPPYEGPQP